jgi:hypothetical protein
MKLQPSDGSPLNGNNLPDLGVDRIVTLATGTKGEVDGARETPPEGVP